MPAEKIGVWSLPHSFQVGFNHRNAIKETAVELDLGKSLPAKTNRVAPVSNIKQGVRCAGAKNILIVVVRFLAKIGGIVGSGNVNAGFRTDRVFKTVLSLNDMRSIRMPLLSGVPSAKSVKKVLSRPFNKVLSKRIMSPPVNVNLSSFR